MPLAPFSGTLGKKASAHLLRRATFGATKTDIDTFAGYSATQALNELFRSVALPAAPVLPGGGAWVNTAPIPDEDDAGQQAYFIQWWLGQLLHTNVAPADRMAFSTRERVTFFLHTHLTTIQEVVDSSRALYFQNALLRRYAFDGGADPLLNIRDLTKKICIDNAMLILLDGRLNVKGSPNENFARELFELYTIGKGLSGQEPASTTPGDYTYYTEQDVQAAALVLSGFTNDITFATLDADTGLPRGKAKTTTGNVANQHDNSVKQFSARMGNTVITPNATPATEDSIIDEISQLINMIYAQPETAKNICRKIYRFFVYHEITVAIDNSIIADLAATLVANNYKIEPVIKELLGSQHFYDSMDASVDNDNFGALIKSPLDLVCGTLNFFEYEMPDFISNTQSFYDKAESLVRSMADQGMKFVNPYDVAGYEAYHQYPLFNRHWINTNALTQRYKFILDTMTTENMNDEAVTLDLLDYYSDRFAGNALDPDALVRDVASYLFPLSTETTEITTARLDWFTLQFMKLGEVLNQAQPAFWQFSWTNRDTIAASKEDARGMLQDKINTMLQSPEYQLF
ncbi:MAG: hypothetical protein K0R51_588 [Cytophagaceae bacterium]|jgi:uncharacterized protein (DUF1800 family)|nr:hypothetical protein [Cytophagaceae bacterium]